MNQPNPVFELQEPVAIVIDAAQRDLRGDDDPARSLARWKWIIATQPVDAIVTGVAIALTIVRSADSAISGRDFRRHGIRSPSRASNPTGVPKA